MNKSLQRKILYTFMAVLIIVWLGVALGTSALIRDYFFKSKERELVNKGHELANLVSDYYAGNMSLDELHELIDSIDSFLEARVWVLDEKLEPIVISTPKRYGVRPRRIHPPVAEQDGDNARGISKNRNRGVRTVIKSLEMTKNGKVWTRTFYHPFYQESMIMAAVPVINAEGNFIGQVLLNAPVRGMNEFLQRIYVYIAFTGVIAILLTIWIVNRLAKGIVQPLKEMQQAAFAMAKGDYHIRIKNTTEDEVGQLGSSLNSLAEDLAAFVQQTQKEEKLRRDFVANVSHELRTPLTIIRGYHEALADGTVSETDQIVRYQKLIQNEIKRLERLIKDLLDLSRLQASGASEEKDKIPVNAIIQSVAAMMEQRLTIQQVALDLQLNSLPDVFGNGDRLIQLLLIILDNAAKYTAPGGKITVTTNTEQDRVVLTVKDTGKGIPAEDLAFIWERFYKVDKSHGKHDYGTGLGLAIAKEIIDLHSAESEVTSKVGEGTTFKIKFPYR